VDAGRGRDSCGAPSGLIARVAAPAALGCRSAASRWQCDATAPSPVDPGWFHVAREAKHVPPPVLSRPHQTADCTHVSCFGAGPRRHRRHTPRDAPRRRQPCPLYPEPRHSAYSVAAQHRTAGSRADPPQRKDELEYWLTEHLRLNGLYWGLTALHLLGHPEALPRGELLEFVFSCLHEDGGFGAAPGHDAHMLYTVSGVQILATLDAFGELDERVEDGRLRIAGCTCGQALVITKERSSHELQLLQICRILRLAPLRAMNGASRTHAFCTAP
jgi:hypothetical protein